MTKTTTIEITDVAAVAEKCPDCGEDTVLACDDDRDPSTEYGLCKSCEWSWGNGDTRTMAEVSR